MFKAVGHCCWCSHTNMTNKMAMLSCSTFRHTLIGIVSAEIRLRTLSDTELCHIIRICLLDSPIWMGNIWTRINACLSTVIRPCSFRACSHTSVCRLIGKSPFTYWAIPHTSSCQIVLKLTWWAVGHTFTARILGPWAFCAPVHTPACMRVSIIVGVIWAFYDAHVGRVIAELSIKTWVHADSYIESIRIIFIESIRLWVIRAHVHTILGEVVGKTFLAFV